MIRAGGLLALVLLVPGCTGGSSTSGERPTAGPTTAAPSASASATVAVTASATATATVPAVGSKDFGFFTKVLSSGRPVRLSFDRALFLTGAAADRASAAHGGESPVPNDYYIVNDNRLLRTLELAPDVQVLGSLGLNSFVGDNSVDLHRRTVAELLDYVATEPGRETGFNLVYGSGGLVVRVAEQYVP